MSSLSIGKAWDEAKAALIASRRLLVPIALGLVLLPAVIMAMIEPPTAAGQQPPAGPWMLVALVMVVVMSHVLSSPCTALSVAMESLAGAG